MRPRETRRGVIWLVLAAVLPLTAEGQDLIDRRQQARGSFLATPQGIYEHFCAHCHGDDATGGGRLWASELAPEPSSLVDTSLDGSALVSFITAGSAAAGRSNLCPPWGHTLPSTDINRLARYILSLRRAPASPAPGSSDQPRTNRFPWLLVTVLAGEVGLILRLRLRRKETANAIPEDPAVRG